MLSYLQMNNPKSDSKEGGRRSPIITMEVGREGRNHRQMHPRSGPREVYCEGTDAEEKGKISGIFLFLALVQ